jgi:hypothetical protein
MLMAFQIPGQPVPQPRHQVTRRGIAYIPTDHPIRAYKARIVEAAARLVKTPTDQPVAIWLAFIFERPKSHRHSTGLRKGARTYPPKCDWDNLAKGVCDGLTKAGVWIDDDQVVLAKVERRYAEEGEEARTEITVTTFDEDAEQ